MLAEACPPSSAAADVGVLGADAVAAVQRVLAAREHAVFAREIDREVDERPGGCGRRPEGAERFVERLLGGAGPSLQPAIRAERAAARGEIFSLSATLQKHLS